LTKKRPNPPLTPNPYRCCLRFGLFLFSPLLRTCEKLYVAHCGLRQQQLVTPPSEPTQPNRQPPPPNSSPLARYPPTDMPAAHAAGEKTSTGLASYQPSTISHQHHTHFLTSIPNPSQRLSFLPLPSTYSIQYIHSINSANSLYVPASSVARFRQLYTNDQRLATRRRRRCCLLLGSCFIRAPTAYLLEVSSLRPPASTANVLVTFKRSGGSCNCLLQLWTMVRVVEKACFHSNPLPSSPKLTKIYAFFPCGIQSIFNSVFHKNPLNPRNLWLIYPCAAHPSSPF